MKLSDLEATFVGRFNPQDGSFYEHQTINEAQGVMFICPACHNHNVLTWFRTPRNGPSVPPEAFPRPGRWDFSGTSINDLTLSPSIDLSQREHKPGENVCNWHGWVKNGDAT